MPSDNLQKRIEAIQALTMASADKAVGPLYIHLVDETGNRFAEIRRDTPEGEAVMDAKALSE